MRWLAVVTLALCALAGGWAFGGFGRLAGASSSDPWRTIERVSVASDGSQGNGDSGDPTLIIGADHPAISADGRYVAFASGAANLVPGDTNTCGFGATIGSCPDVFVHDRQTGTTERVSVASDGSQGNGRSDAPAISADGRYVAFGSFADNLVQGDTNTVWDVFVHDRQTGTTERVSVASNGSQGDDASYAPAISADGRYVAFGSGATNLVPGDTNADEDVFVAAYQGMLQGDVDCSGSVNALDALQLVLYAASLTANQSPGCPAIGVGVGSGPPLFGDVDCDGDVTAVDAAKILRFAANLFVAQNPGCPAIGASLTAG